VLICLKVRPETLIAKAVNRVTFRDRCDDETRQTVAQQNTESQRLASRFCATRPPRRRQCWARESWQPLPGEWQTTFTLITTAANRLLQPIHNHPPVILDEVGADDWRNVREPDPLSIKRLLVPAPDDF